MSESVFAITLPACVNAAELAGVLTCPEFLGAWEEEGSVVLYWKGDRIHMVERVREAGRVLGVDVPADALQCQSVAPKDWNAVWAASVQPLRIGRRLGIRPSWTTMDLPADGIELIIDPKQAFGTGHHATTQMILEWLEDVRWQPGLRVLDIGTGSGILAMAALRLGASRAVGIDVDTTAVDCARDYAAVNHFGDELELSSRPLETFSDQGFDIILANLDRKTILSMYREWSRMRNARTHLVVSGLLEEDESDMVRLLEEAGWQKAGLSKREGWIAVHLEHVSSGSSSSG